MKHNNALLDKFTRSSLRLNKGMVVLLSLALLLVGTSYWSFQRLVSEQHVAVSFHFARLMENIQEHEAFLKALSQRSQQGELLRNDTTRIRLLKRIPEEGPNIYQGQEFSFSMPFSVKLDPQRFANNEREKILSLGAHLATMYSAFWSTSHYQAPQVFLVNQQDSFDITVPAAGHSRAKTVPSGESFPEVMNSVLERLPGQHPDASTGGIIWERFSNSADTSKPPRLLGHIGVQLQPENVTGKDAESQVVLATLLDMAQMNNFERTMKWSVYDHFTLVAPSGEVLAGSLRPESPLYEGTNFKPDGLVFKVTNPADPKWTAIYAINYQSFFRYALWSLIGLAAFLLSVIFMGWGANHWYRKQVVVPARRAHDSLAESEAFSRVVIDTAPTGLCVVRRSDNLVLIENQRAQQWQGTAKLISALDRQYQVEMGETHLQIDGRHLQVDFVSTRYQGQDVRLYAFNDVTRHIEDAAALEDARRAADAANKAKTLFLATMSHEIRTPLYGVLGTLELLGLTHLEPRQQAYLQTIQRSSATLFQLISDVLDVSKIESGQMAIESIEFCPLDLIEDTLHTYAAFAQRKGLQLYACTDATLPDRLLGDPMRIRQILNNLLSNAIKFTDTGRVVLRTRVLERGNGQVSLEWQVTDTGIGIAETQLGKLFELFYQVQDAHSESGAGLGLPICWWLCGMMNGQMKVVSEPGLGSSFALRMPLPVMPGILSASPSIVPGTTPVYVRAPVQELAQSLSDWLIRLGFQATVASSSLESKHTQAVLVDALPCATEHPWPGPRVYCTPGGRNPPEYTSDGWDVDLHDVRAIALAVSQALQGKQQPSKQEPLHVADNLQLRILVAEDNPINQAIIKEQLEALGCTVVVASNGEHAMHLWQPGSFDLMLTDVNMPVMNGYELARTLREHDPELPIIGVTANAMREEGMRCIAVGMNAWIVKPLSLQTLRTHLLKLCRPSGIMPAPRIEPDTINATVPAQATDSIQLSPAMRPLFISTMQDDIQLISSALEQSDCRIVAQRLHSIAGALGAVQVVNLAQHCTELECQLAGGILDMPLTLKVQQILTRISAVVDSLQ